MAIYLGKHFAAEKGQQSAHPLPCFLRSGMTVGYLLDVDGEDIGNGDLIGITRAFLRCLDVLSVEVRFEFSFSVETSISAAACALLIFAVSNDIDGWVRDAPSSIAPFAPEPQARSLVCNRHRRLISSIAASVV
jgi:hypothetical protein